MTPEQAGFLSRIRAEPREDTHRVAYADWLVENGEPAGRERGAFVAYQCAYAWHDANNGDRFAGDSRGEHPEAAGVWPYEEWPDSVSALLDLNGDSLFPLRYRWRRGFVDELELPLGRFWPRARRLFESHPVERVRVTGRLPHADGPRTFEWMARDDVPGVPVTECGVPFELARWLRGYRRKSMSSRGRSRRAASGTWRFAYPTAAAALADLDAACVRYGRFLCGLPQLAEHTEAG